MKLINIGDELHRWTVISGPQKRGDCWMLTCRCRCGVVRPVDRSRLLRGLSKSCGCFRAERMSTIAKQRLAKVRAAGLVHLPTYNSWRTMISRCYRRGDASFKHYGAKGITVCKRWRNSYKNFERDMGRRPPGMTLDREKSSRNYTPGNCRWTDIFTQMSNHSRARHITFNGETKCINAWARETGLPAGRIRDRLNRGWSVARVLST